MSNSLLSIVIPSYNMENYIRRNLDNLVAIKNIHLTEIIIVNDGSKDNTLAVAKEYKERFPDNIVIIDKPNGHYGSCINAALKAAKGKYFRILDADDWFDSEALDTFLQKLADCDADLVVTQRVEIETDKSGNETATRYPIRDIEYGKVYDARTFSINKHSKGVEFNMHSMTYKTALLRQVGLLLPVGICYTDLLYCLTPLRETKTLVAFNIYLYHYLVGREGNTTNKDSLKRNLTHSCRVAKLMFEYLDRQDNAQISDVLRENQMRFVREAFVLVLSGLLMKKHCDAETYEYIRPLIDYCKKYNVELWLFNKYYYRHWYNKNTCLALNLSLLLYYATHPIKLFRN